MWAIIRTVVVFPLVPVTAMIGMRAGAPGGNSRSMTGRATYCGSPSVGWVCIRKPGAALTSTMPPPVSRTGTVMSGQMKSMPAMSRPTMRAAVSAISTLSGWASIVRSMLVPPVDMLPVSASFTRRPSGGTSSRPKPCALTSSIAASSSLIFVSTFSWPMPRRGSALVEVDQLADRAHAVAGDAGRDALGDGGERAADDQAAVVVAGDVALDDDVATAALAQGLRERGPDVRLVLEVEGDAPAVIAVERLDDTREAEALRRGDGVVLGLDHLAAGHRQAGRVEQPVGQLLVARDVDARWRS